jgi:hypothetical protein
MISKQWVTASTAPDPADRWPFLSYADLERGRRPGWDAHDRGYYAAPRTPRSADQHFPKDRLIIAASAATRTAATPDKVIETVAAKVK